MSFLTGAVASLGGVPESRVTLSGIQRDRLRATLDVFQRVSRETGVPWYLLAGIAWNESGFKADAVNSTSGARGLMQVMPSWFGTATAAPITGANWADPYVNVTAGAKIILYHGYKTRSLLDTFARYGGFSTWIKTGKAEKDGVYKASLDPRPYLQNFVARGTYLALAHIAGEV